jgi:hypothetical protein
LRLEVLKLEKKFKQLDGSGQRLKMKKGSDEVKSPAKLPRKRNAMDLRARVKPATQHKTKSTNVVDPLVGKEVAVWWDRYKQVYVGKVVATDNPKKGSHIVCYEDGQGVYEQLVGKNAVKFRILDVV